jgi:RNA polymerase sigma-70 factor (ECF subfamily)
LDASTETPALTDHDLLQVGYRYGLALTHRPEDAEDLVQEAWLNLSRRYGNVPSRAVLFTAVRHLFIDHCRRQKIVRFESLDAPEAPAVPPVDGEEPGLQGDVAALLGTLRAQEREVIFLHYYEGRTAEEIGELTAQPRGTVLSLMHRGIARLREAALRTPGATRCNQWLLFFVPFI